MLACAGCEGGSRDEAAAEPIGLYTSLPILWHESRDLSSLLDSDAPRHWVRDVLDSHGQVQPIDDLAASQGAVPLPRTGLLVMAQPRPLSGDENVALDKWVREGGRLLLFADPMLTARSDFALGDKRRPQDVVLLSPILSRWGLELQFDEAQPPGEHMMNLLGKAARVNLPGRFALSGNSRDCTILPSGLAARCRIGAGHILAVADAAMLENAPEHGIPDRAAVLEACIESLETGD